jgi:hypothetical protein
LNCVSLKVSVIATIAALSVLFLSTAGAASAAKRIGKNGVIHACFKAKGKNKGALRVVATKRACRKMRGWRPLSWNANRPSKKAVRVRRGRPGPQGGPGPEGMAGTAGQVEKSLLETIQNQSAQINALTAQVTDLGGKVLSLESGLSGLTGDLATLEDTVGEACGQLAVLTDQTDEVLAALLGASIGGIVGGILEIPSPPDPLGSFECGG